MIEEHTCQLSYYQIPTKTNKTDTKLKHNKLDITQNHGLPNLHMYYRKHTYIGLHMYYRKHTKIILVLVKKNVNHTNLFIICVYKTPFYFVHNFCFYFFFNCLVYL